MITQSQFTAFKEDAIRRQPIRKRIQLSDLKFHTMDTVEYCGVMLGINRRGLADVVKLIGMSQSGSKNLQSVLGENSAIDVLNSLKSIIGSTNKEVMLAVTPDRVITRVTPTAQSPLFSTETYFDTFERMANRHNL